MDVMERTVAGISAYGTTASDDCSWSPRPDLGIKAVKFIFKLVFGLFALALLGGPIKGIDFLCFR